MNAKFKHVKEIFLAALEIEVDSGREAYLREACAHDPALRGQVDALLRRHEQAGSFLQFPSPALSPLAGEQSEPRPLESGSEPRPSGSGRVKGTSTIDDPITERPGTIIGAYKLMEQIGEGGMGLVFVAEQQYPVRRKVALKVIKPGMDTRAVVARFEAERQALALMDHPNIARVHDGGETSSGRPYFVMELVKGIPITSFCDQNRLTTRERLELFIHVCEAVQHAHQKGIIHRDIKPTNVLVVSHDGTPVVKVIDFGVAKSIGQQLTDKTIYTQFVQLVGTPLYMSPEQAGESGLDVDTRSDIYSLGVLLYELLTGTTPFNKERLKEASYEEIRRIIREEEPPKPSTRISTLGQAANTVSTQRRSDPSKLRQMVRGELDWIVMKAMEKDRGRRYQTANGLAMDVQRYLHDEPVLACPPSATYRLQKFARKYRALLRIASVFVVFLVLAAAVSIWQAIRATQAEKQALTERNRAQASFKMARDAVYSLFTQVSQNPRLKAQPMEKFRKDLLKSAKEFQERFIEQFDAPEVRHDLGLAYLRLADIERELSDYAAAEDSLGKAMATFRVLLDEQPGTEENERDLGASYALLGQLYLKKARFDKADAAYQQALAYQEKLAGIKPASAEYRYALAKTYSELGLAVQKGDHPENALNWSQKAQDILTELMKEYPLVSEYQSVFIATQINLGQIFVMRSMSEKAETAFKEAQSVYEGLVRDQADIPAEHLESWGKSLALLGMSYKDQFLIQKDRALIEKARTHQEDAMKIFRSLAKEHSNVLDFEYDVGRCHMALGETEDRGGRLEDASAQYDKAIALLQIVWRKGYPLAQDTILHARTERAITWAKQGAHARAINEAEALVRQGNLRGLDTYNIACVFSCSSAAAEQDTKLLPEHRARLKAQYADRGVALFRQSVEKGFRYLDHIKLDPDLDPLRMRKDFQEILADLEAKEKESGKRSREAEGGKK
jgi:serine/threonine protein kinase